MNRQNCKICEVCHESFIPGPRVGDRQRVCKKSSCKNERKRRSQKEWLKENKDYFEGRYPYLKEWLRQNPGYLKKYRKKKREQAASDIQDKLRKIRLSADMDFLDDVLLPREGIVIRGNYEGSFKSLGSTIDYTRQEISAHIYHTINRRHTACFFAFWGESCGDLPIYNFFYKSGPDKFIGVEYDQLVARKLNILRFDYRYEYKKDIFIKLIVNAALNCKYRFQSYIFSKNVLLGYGLGLKFLSPAGPLQIIFARGKKSVYAKSKERNVLYFTAGYRF